MWRKQHHSEEDTHGLVRHPLPSSGVTRLTKLAKTLHIIYHGINYYLSIFQGKGTAPPSGDHAVGQAPQM